MSVCTLGIFVIRNMLPSENEFPFKVAERKPTESDYRSPVGRQVHVCGFKDTLQYVSRSKLNLGPYVALKEKLQSKLIYHLGVLDFS